MLAVAAADGLVCEMTFPICLVFIGVAALMAGVVHFFVRRYWGAVFISAPAVSLLNIVHELFRHDFRVRPADVAFWIPMLFIEGIVVAWPVVAIVGIPFYVVRRRRQTKGGPASQCGE